MLLVKTDVAQQAKSRSTPGVFLGSLAMGLVPQVSPLSIVTHRSKRPRPRELKIDKRSPDHAGGSRQYQMLTKERQTEWQAYRDCPTDNRSQRTKAEKPPIRSAQSRHAILTEGKVTVQSEIPVHRGPDGGGSGQCHRHPHRQQQKIACQVDDHSSPAHQAKPDELQEHGKLELG